MKDLTDQKQEAIVTLILQEEDEFEAISDQLADDFQSFVGSNVPLLSDTAISRVGIYEEHL
ncbi:MULTISPECIES: hypothetical protein [Leptolyngbya]|uniref:hypothetical protein n=1 Tax=Leptolyngbya TaxID=47251 RepID=UPI001686C22F|nr:hypothetical protein [Leptolyngbya sp. FACHB-1624]MBD1857731.1 hypothetical protein [Leptolyngbya sp. FACHB-1624]